jgi:hypothetical protein
MGRWLGDELESLTDHQYFALETAWIQEGDARLGAHRTMSARLYLPVAFAAVLSVSLWLGRALFNV